MVGTISHWTVRFLSPKHSCLELFTLDSKLLYSISLIQIKQQPAVHNSPSGKGSLKMNTSTVNIIDSAVNITIPVPKIFSASSLSFFPKLSPQVVLLHRQWYVFSMYAYKSLFIKLILYFFQIPFCVIIISCHNI